MRTFFSSNILACVPIVGVLLWCAPCSDRDADGLGVAAECVANEDCAIEDGQQCLLDFRGGYCGIVDCDSDIDCPKSSACVAHDDGKNYCFRTCVDKSECNANRSADNEANCSSNINFVEVQDNNIKACVPPSS